MIGMAVYEIPLNNTNQKFNVSLNKTMYKLQFIYRGTSWFMDVMTTAEEYLIAAIPIVMGDNLLAQHQHIITGSMYVANAHEDESQSYNDLGTKIRLFWSDA